MTHFHNHLSISEHFYPSTSKYIKDLIFILSDQYKSNINEADVQL